MNNRHPNEPGHDDLGAGQEVLAPTNATADQTLAVDLARVEIDQLIATAHKFPRNLKVVADKIDQMASFNEAAAEHSVYALPRGGKPIVGPSIGFANIVAYAFGNCWDYGRWIHTDRREKVVVAEGIFVDWETNRRLAMSEQRRIVGARGQLYTDDMIIVTSKAAASIARRNAILNAVPRFLWFSSYEKALYIVRGSEATLVERRDKAVKALANFGVDPKQVFLFLGVRDMGEIGVEHMPTLRGIYAALREGNATPEELFDPRKMTGKGFVAVDNPLADTEEDEEIDGDGVVTPARTATQQSPAQRLDAQIAAAEADEGADDDAPFDAGKPVQRQTNAQDAPADAPKQRKPRKAKDAPGPAANQAAVGTLGPDDEDEGAATQAAVAVPPAKPQPKNTEEYKTYWRGIMGEATSGAALDNRWKSPVERALRGNCSVISQDMDELRAMTSARVQELGG